MTSLTQDIQDKLKRLTVLEKIIAINIIVFLIVLIATRLFNAPQIMTWLQLPRDFKDFIYKPWTLITYGFTHYGFLHILFNLLVLYFISNTMHNLFSNKITLSIYFLGIICGAVVFLLVYNLLPQSMLKPVGALVGASAGIRALLIFLCAYMPYREARFFMIKIKLWHIGAAVVLFDCIGLFSLNQGGNVAHMGGSLLGYLYAVQLQKGINIGKGFERFIELFKFEKGSPLKTVHKRSSNKMAGHTKKEFNEFNKQKRIDLILDKISKSGYESLTEEEKAFLFKAKD
ncbi:MAG: rhomboid family intramembrane serine protease [Gelidibacter sp.]